MVTNVNSSILIVGGPHDGERHDIEPAKYPDLHLIIKDFKGRATLVEDVRANTLDVKRAQYLRDSISYCLPGEKEVQTLYFYRYNELKGEDCLHRLLNCYKPL